MDCGWMITSIWSGLLNGAANLLGRTSRPADRGAVPVKIGLTIYDWVSRSHRALPKHRFLGESLGGRGLSGGCSRRFRFPSRLLPARPERRAWVRTERIDLTPLLTHSFSLDDIGEAYELFGERRDGVVKVAIRP